MEIFAFIFALVGGLFALTFSLMSAWAKSYNLWPLALAFSLGAIALAFLVRKKVKNVGFYLIGLAILSWIFVSKIFYMPAVILVFAGFLALIFEREEKQSKDE